MNDDGVVGVVLTNERYQMLVADAASGEAARHLADDFDARIQRLTQECDDLRRQLAERDEAERDERPATPRAEPDEAMVDRIAELEAAVAELTEARVTHIRLLDEWIALGDDAVRAIGDDSLSANEAIHRLIRECGEWRDRAHRAEERAKRAERQANDRLEANRALMGKLQEERAEADLAATDSDLARRLAECEAERDQAHDYAQSVLRDLAAMQRKSEQAEAERDDLRQALRDRPEPAEAGPLVEFCEATMKRHHWADEDGSMNYTRAAREIAAHVERSLPEVETVADAMHGAHGAGPEWHDDARNILALVRTSLGLDAAAPKREEPSEPESAGTWATLPEDVRKAAMRYGKARESTNIDDVCAVADDLATVPHRWKAEAELAELRAARQPAPLSDEEVERLAEAASYQRHYMPDPVDWRAIVRAVLAHPLVAQRMAPPQSEPPTVPVLALPSVEEVDEAVRTELRRAGSLQVGRIRNAVIDLVRERQPAAFRNALAKWRALPKGHRGRFVEDRWLLVFADAEACRVASILLDTLDALEGE